MEIQTTPARTYQKRTNKKLWIGLVLCLYAEMVSAQAWTKADSLWLRDVLAGKDTIRLNPEFQQAIRNGTFLRLDEAAGTMRIAPSALPIGRNFSEYIRPEKDSSSRRKVALKDLPPAVFKRYGLDKPLPFNGIYANAYTSYTPYAGPPMTGIGTSFNDALASLFSPSARRKAHNRKHATAWKTYNGLPSAADHQKQKQFRAAHPELVLRPRALTPTADTAGRKDTLSGAASLLAVSPEALLADSSRLRPSAKDTLPRLLLPFLKK